MIKKFYLSFVCSFLCFALAYANNTLSLQSLSIEQGTTESVLPVSLTNENGITGFQCDLYLPSGVTVATDEYGDYMIEVARTTANRHTVSTSLQDDGALRILCTSMTNAIFSGNSGIVLNVTLAIPESITADTHDMSLKNIVLSDTDANRYTSPDMTATLSVKDGSTEESVNTLSLQDLSIEQGITESVLPVSLTNESGITGFQCDLYLPSGVTVATDEYGDYMIEVARTTANRHTVSTSLQDDGALRILCTSMTNAIFSGNSGIVLNVTLAIPESITAGTHDMSLKNIVLSDTDANRYTSPDMTATLSVKDGSTEESVNTLSLQDLSIEQGITESVLPVSLTNESGITGFQCDLYLPSGVTVATDEYGDYMIEVARTTANRHTVSTSLQDDGALRILCTSMTNAIFSGNSGIVLNVTLAIPESITAGTHDMSLKNIVLSDPEANRYTSPDMTSSLIVAEMEKITIKANNITMVYGDEIPKLTFTSEGVGLVGTPSLSCSATPTSPVGTYPITITKGSIDNNNVTYVNGILTIVKAPLKVYVGDYRRNKGEENPVFEILYEGFKNNETVEVLIKLPVAFTTATKDSPAGVYDILVAGGDADNYRLEYEYGTLTIEPCCDIVSPSLDMQLVDVYSIEGILVKKQVLMTDISSMLPKGLYIVNGRKVVIK